MNRGNESPRGEPGRPCPCTSRRLAPLPDAHVTVAERSALPAILMGVNSSTEPKANR
jgi:hypothetical protein